MNAEQIDNNRVKPEVKKRWKQLKKNIYKLKIFTYTNLVCIYKKS